MLHQTHIHTTAYGLYTSTITATSTTQTSATSPSCTHISTLTVRDGSPLTRHPQTTTMTTTSMKKRREGPPSRPNGGDPHRRPRTTPPRPPPQHTPILYMRNLPLIPLDISQRTTRTCTSTPLSRRRSGQSLPALGRHVADASSRITPTKRRSGRATTPKRWETTGHPVVQMVYADNGRQSRSVCGSPSSERNVASGDE